MADKQKVIIMKIPVKGTKESFKTGFPVPNGVGDKLTLEIVDEYVSFRFMDYRITKAWLKAQKTEGIESHYLERQQKVVSKYPGMSQEELYNKFYSIFKARMDEVKQNGR